MRVTRLFAVSCFSVIFTIPANAQKSSSPTRSVDDYVCAFTGECDNQPSADNSVAAPPTRGFRLVPEKQTSSDAQSASTPTTKRSASGTAAGSHNAAVHPQVASKRGSSARNHSAATQPRRMDLRVSFLLGSAELTEQAREEAKVFAKALLLPELASKRFLIEGHTDSSGSRALNLDLSKRRAGAVADFLASLGVPRNQLEVRGYGPDRPLPGHPRSSPENRRVEAELL